VRKDLCQDHPDLAELPLIQADTTDPASLLAMASQAKVLLTTTGPYVKYGPPVVAACVEAGTDYVDITGEPAFVAETIRKHHDAAADKKLRLVHCCGYDSIPHDLGAWFTVQQLPQEGPIEVREYARIGGRLSGGTWNSALEHMGHLTPPDLTGLISRDPQRTARGLRGSKLHRPELGGWAYSPPMIDPLIVLKSANSIGYGPQFRFGFYVHFSKLHTLLGLGVGVATVATLAKFGPARRLLQRQMPSGAGPTEEQMQQGWMKTEFIGEEGDVRVHTRVSTDIDAGYAFTARMISSAALCLARDRDKLSDRHGVVTTAAAMAEPLMARLQDAGMKFEVL
jgi:short subunit dehydrogenase-like uncharacterized protein